MRITPAQILELPAFTISAGKPLVRIHRSDREPWRCAPGWTGHSALRLGVFRHLFWTGSGYIIARGTASAYRISGGANGGIFSLVKYFSPVGWAEMLGVDGGYLTAVKCADGAWGYYKIVFLKKVIKKFATRLVIAAVMGLALGPLLLNILTIVFIINMLIAVWNFVHNFINGCLPEVVSGP